MDRLWESFAPLGWRPFAASGRGQLMPTLDVFEKEGILHVQAELPGLTPQDVQIEVAGDALTISGEKKDEREVKEENYYRSERRYGSFRRQVALPPGADTDQVQATFKDGVLRLEIPVKAAPVASKKIEIKEPQ
jgi:HSP20 family protein